jgi:endoglucanase
MRRFKKAVAVIIAAAMTMGVLAGCGTNGNSSSEEDSAVVQENDSSDENSDNSETDSENADSQDTEEATTEEATEESVGISDGDKSIELTFDNDTEDFVRYMNGGDEEISNVDGELCVDILKTGNLDYANQVYYDGFKLYEGCVYTFSFDVHSDLDRKIEWRLQINGSDYHAYAGDIIDVSSDVQHVTAEFTMNEDSDPAPRLCFNMGKAEGMTGDEGEHHIYFDNIVLEVKDSSSAQKIEALPEPMVVNINQVGYETSDTKIATISNVDAETMDVINVDTGETVYTAQLSDMSYNRASDEQIKKGDFSEVTTPGTYKIVTNTGDESYEFPVNDTVYDDMYKDVILMLYNQRCGTELDSSISGDFAHDACHTGEAVVYGTDTKIDVTGGWHDAGDYGRYVVPGAKTIADLFLTYEDAGVDADDIGIPESGNGVPDVLDEARYELDWMLKMQDKSSGGVYHKVTCAVFPEVVMPVEETDQLIACPISNTATGDFAAVMAKASVLYAEYDKEFADTCLEAAKSAYEYLMNHEGEAGYTDPDDIETGTYPDNCSGDEYLWAAVELYIATGDTTYKTYADEKIESGKQVKYGLGWADVGYYALYDYCVYDGSNSKAKELLISGADDVVKVAEKNGYGASLYDSFPWGSNMTIANNGMLLIMADKIAGTDTYTTYASYQKDYLLGRNSVSYCFVTGYGTRSPLNTHHRPSQVLEESMPGMLVGGPNSDLSDSYAKAVLSEMAPASCYVDNAQSYSCNEITIYWNSPLIYLLSVLK